MTGWQAIGSVSAGPLDDEVIVGSVDLPEQGGILLRVTQTGGRSPWPFSYGLAYVRNSSGRELGTVKVFAVPEGDVVWLGQGMPSTKGVGVLYFIPRFYNRHWLEASGERMGLRFEYALPAYLQPDGSFRARAIAEIAGRLLPLIRVNGLGRLSF
jgi:hypothetical protein